MNKRFELCTLGKYDIPSKQKQSDFKVDLASSNVAVFGSAMSGKTNILNHLINCLHKSSDEMHEQIFILDFGGAMQEYKDMPLVSAYFDNTNEEYVKRVFIILESILKENIKNLGSKNFQSGRSSKIPHTTFIIDNINAFLDENRYSAYHEKLGRLCRDGRSRGISIVFSATDTKGASRYLLSFEQKISLNFPSDKCSEIFTSKVEAVGNIQGRGFANVTEKPNDIIGTFNLNAPYEVQTIKCADISKESGSFVENLRKKFEYDENTKTYRRQVKKYQTFPSDLLMCNFEKLRQPLDANIQQSENTVNVGLDYVEFKPVGIDFDESRVIAIYGKKEFGKTNLLRLILEDLSKLKCNSRLVFFDDGRKQLNEFYEKYKTTHKCDYIYEYQTFDINMKNNVSIKRKLSPIQQFYRLIHERYMDLYYGGGESILETIYGVDGKNIYIDDIPEGKSKSDGEPTVFIIQSKSAYINSKINSDFIHFILPELVDLAEENDFIFIFTDVKKMTDGEINSVFNTTLKTAFLLDNIAEFANERGVKTVFGEMDNKMLKEDYARCELGDGYCYNVEADSLKKVKFIKSEE